MDEIEQIMALDPSERAEALEAWTAKRHAAVYPAGCPNLCMRCVTRLGIQPVVCRVCGQTQFPRGGVMPEHKIRMKGRRGYSAAHMQQFAPKCTGSGHAA
jgi:hypothetical protein